MNPFFIALLQNCNLIFGFCHRSVRFVLYYKATKTKGLTDEVARIVFSMQNNKEAFNPELMKKANVA